MGGRSYNKKRKGGGDNRILKRDFKKGKRDNVWQEGKSRKPDERGDYKPYDKNNEKFEEYYKGQKIVPEGEWDTFMECLRTPLPTSFRINGTGKYSEDIRDQIENKLFAKVKEGSQPIDEEGNVVEPPRPVRWYPDRLAWQFNYSRQQLRRLDFLESIHDFVKRANEYGSITRQETVSMIPAFFLNITPDHRVLDMCAAPGSKTFQLLEMLHGSLGEEKEKIPTGFVIANDVDLKRCNLLTHQTKRANSPGLLVTNHEAQNFPDIVSRGGRTFQFDAILCDVPCSGDGTMRKAPDIWPRWSVGNGNGLHPLQLKIAIRAAQLLKVGGRLVYSTCTFNPIENEAVIAALLEQSEGSLELLDMSGQLPELRRTPGIHTWEVHTKAGKANSFEEGQEVAKVHPTMWPKPSYQKLPLERCMRLLPHHDDTGGFFVAVFEKKTPMPASLDPPPKKLKGPITVKTDLVVDQTGTVKVEFSLVNTFELRAEREAFAANGGKPAGPEDELLLTETRGGGTRNRQGGGSQFGGLDPILPVSDTKVIHSIRDTYGIDLAKLSLDKNAVTRTADNTRPKRIYALTDGLREYLAADHKEQLKVIAAGLKVFERQEHKEATAGGGQCDFRLVQDGLHVMLPFVTKQIIHPTLDELRLILQRRSLQLPGAEDPEKPDRAKFMDDATKAEVNAAVSGSCVFVPRISDADVAALPAGCSPEEIAIACWKGKSSVNLLVSKVETDHLLEKLGMPAGAKDAAKGGGMEVN